MRKLMVLVAMLAMMMVAAAPAFAQQESGDAEFNAGLANEKGNQCAQIVNQQNTGNVVNNAFLLQLQEVFQVNFAEIFAFFSDVDLTQSNSNAQNGEINQTGVAQGAAAEQNCKQELKK